MSKKKDGARFNTALQALNHAACPPEVLDNIASTLLEYAGVSEARFYDARTIVMQLNSELARVSSIMFPELRHAMRLVERDLDVAYCALVKKHDPKQYIRMCQVLGVEPTLEKEAPTKSKAFTPGASIEQTKAAWRKYYTGE